MSYIFYLNEKAKILLRPACIQLCPELASLNEKELLVIMLVYDNHSTLRRYNEMDRIRRAILQIFDDNSPKLLDALENPQPNHRITNAVNAYKSLQYDPKTELALAYQRKIDSLQELLESENGPTAISNILKSIAELRKNIHSLENEIAQDVIAEGRIEGDKELSFLEKLQSNRKLYIETINRKPQRHKAEN